MKLSIQPKLLMSQSVKPVFSMLMLTLTSFISVPEELLASPTRLIASIQYVAPAAFPAGRGAPGRRSQGGSRGPCLPDSETSLTALVPTYETILKQDQGDPIPVTNVWGLTAAERSSLWFYVPYAKSSVTSVGFILQDEGGKNIYEAPVTLPEGPGMVRVNFPEKAAALKIDQMYHWFFKIKVTCVPGQPAEPDYVEGWVQRVNLSATLANQLQQATPQQKIALYAENGIWFDAINELAELRRTNPTNPALAQAWADLLKSVGLEKLANQPLIK